MPREGYDVVTVREGVVAAIEKMVEEDERFESRPDFIEQAVRSYCSETDGEHTERVLEKLESDAE